MAHELFWLNSHIGTIEQGIELINKSMWNVSVTNMGDKWFVLAGEKTILSSDSHDEIVVFLYGMALAYSVIPDHLLEELRRETGIDDADQT